MKNKNQMQKTEEINEKILSRMRINARLGFTELSKDTAIATSTIFDRVKDMEEKRIVLGYRTLIDFEKIGYTTRVLLLLKLRLEDRDKIKDFLIQHPNVNTVSYIATEYDLICEVLFKNFEDQLRFRKEIEQFQILKLQELFCFKDIKREAFQIQSEVTQ